MKIKKLLIGLMLISTTVFAQGPTHDWAVSYSSSGVAYGSAVAIDDAGNVYATGEFSETVDFDPGPGTANLVSTITSSDVFVSKLDPNGNYVWAFQIGSIDHDFGYDIKVDGSGNVYVAGSFGMTVDFDPGPGTHNLISAGLSDAFVAKYDGSGNLIWANAITGTANVGGGRIALDASGNVAVCGEFQGTIDADPGPGTANLISNGGTDAYLIKWDAAGNYISGANYGGIANEYASGVTFDNSNNILLCGSFSSPTDFDPGPGTVSLSPIPNTSAFILKSDANLGHVWVKQLNSDHTDGVYSYEIATDGSGNVIVGGVFDGTTDLDPGAGTANVTTASTQTNSFIEKLDASGNFVWGNAYVSLDFNELRSVRIDASGNIYAAGYYDDIIDFDFGPATDNRTSIGNNDIFVHKMDGSGNHSWVASTGGPLSDYLYGFDINANGNMAGSGEFEATSDFDPGAGTANLTANFSDVFVFRWTEGAPPPPVTTTELRTADCGIILGSMTQWIYANPVANATAYQFQFDDGSGPTNVIAQNGDKKIKASLVPGIDYSKTYNVTVRAKVGSTWGTYGNVCTVTTPIISTTTLSASFCGVTVPSMNTAIQAISVAGATDYQFRFDDGANPAFSKIRSGGVAAINISTVSSIAPSTTYNVDIRVKVGGTWGNYGTVCTMTTPSNSVTTQLTNTYCNTSQNASNYVYCTSVPGADKYQFKFTEQGNPSNVLVKIVSTSKMKPIWLNGLQNVNYDVIIRARVGGQWTSYGTSCTINISGAPMRPIIMAHRISEPAEAIAEFPEVSLYPNPGDGQFKLLLSQEPAQPFNVSVYNAVGQLVYNKQHAQSLVSINLIGMKQGIYIVKVNINKQNITKKMLIQP
jgi:hypothetical protein